MPPRSKATSLLRRLRNPTTSSRSAQCAFSSPRRSFSSPSNPNPTDTTYTSVSPEEVSHFNALASSWWDPQGPSRILHLMNPLRHDFIRTCRSSVPNDPPPPSTGLKYLDIGCGGGIFAESAARLPTTASVTAVDPSPEVLSIAKAHAKRDPALRSKLVYINTPIELLPAPKTPEDGYDVVSIFEVIEHVENPAQFLDRCTPFVKPGGWLVLSTIARTWMSWFTTNLVAEDLLRIVPRGTHDWRKYINEGELRNHFLLKRTEWTEPRCMGVVYVPGLGWREVRGSEKVGNYFFGVRRVAEAT
ncbi:ubiquinone biosynthesis O-methyltransferase [Annulohypoxylon maeteangense]|uniref:ubiquinone biosynthesis O-methyltransferase n=1 Tax=Annulohypoxylon maeteangense TaxID=1927788 RepID=UPI002007E78F|nr:ubiquinone biosynthesis O-methyltransferase [Annulohypoxylon maeteangense]KAI0888435.1 ubiquinone biosynthesis O-methyltransferase [Annulohypoxylon maeteangense]